VSESIIMGIPMPTGTGMFKLMQTPNSSVACTMTEIGDLVENAFDHRPQALD